MQSTMDPVKRPRRQWGSDRRDAPLPTVPPPVSDRRIRMGRLAIVLTVSAWIAYTCLHDLPAVHRGSGRQRPPGDRGDRLHVRGHGPHRLGDGLPHHPHRLLLPEPGAPPGAPGGHRRLLRADHPDRHRARAVVPGGRAGRAHDAAVGRAPGAPVPAHRAAGRRPARAHVGPRPRDPPAVPRPPRPGPGPARRAVRPLPGRARRLRAVPGRRHAADRRRRARRGRRLPLRRVVAARPRRRPGDRRPLRHLLRRPRRGRAGRRPRDHRRAPSRPPPPRAPPSRLAASASSTAAWSPPSGPSSPASSASSTCRSPTRRTRP